MVMSLIIPGGEYLSSSLTVHRECKSGAEYLFTVCPCLKKATENLLCPAKEKMLCANTLRFRARWLSGQQKA